MKFLAICVGSSKTAVSDDLDSPKASSSTRYLCSSSFRCVGGSRDSAGSGEDELFWSKDLGRHAYGEFSMAVVQANTVMEDSSYIESGPIGGILAPHATLFGVFDGHGGPDASRFVADNLFLHLKKFAQEQANVSSEVIRKAFLETEEGFLGLVRTQWLHRPEIASSGSCSLVGMVCGGLLYVANLGDSRAVLGRVEKGNGEAKAMQLTKEHNVSNESVRHELKLMHPDDSQIVVLKKNVWRVRGLIQISRSIGDAYLKDQEFNKEPLIARFRLSEPFTKPLLSADPQITTQKLSPHDHFVILASDGLWEHLSNQEVVDIIHNYPRNGIARKLIKAALREAARKREVQYVDIRKIESGIRRHFHDDISVIVVFFDPALATRNIYDGPILSIRGNESLRKKILIT